MILAPNHPSGGSREASGGKQKPSPGLPQSSNGVSTRCCLTSPSLVKKCRSRDISSNDSLSSSCAKYQHTIQDDTPAGFSVGLRASLPGQSCPVRLPLLCSGLQSISRPMPPFMAIFLIPDSQAFDLRLDLVSRDLSQSPKALLSHAGLSYSIAFTLQLRQPNPGTPVSLNLSIPSHHSNKAYPPKP